MKRTLAGLLAFCCLSPVALAQEDKPTEKKDEPVRSEKAVEILTKADEITKKVNSVRYKGTAQARGVVAQGQPDAEFEARIVGLENTPDYKFRIEVKYKGDDSAEEKTFTVGSDGDTFFLVDPAEKKVYEDIDPAVIGLRGRQARGVVMREYNHPAPFSDEINGRVVEYMGTEKVADEQCHKIRIEYATAANQVATWYFSTKDYLPRRCDRDFTFPQGTGSTQVILTMVEVDPKDDGNPFASKVPDGYTKTDDFAP